MPIDAGLQAWVSAHLHARDPGLDASLAASFADSEELRVLCAVFQLKLAQAFVKYQADHRLAAPQVDPQPEPHPEPQPEPQPAPQPKPVPDADAAHTPAPCAAPVAATQADAAPRAAFAPMAFTELTSSLPDMKPSNPPLPAVQSRLQFRLANARAGQPYQQKIEAQDVPDADWVLCAISMPDSLGLTADEAGGLVAGIPSAPGDYDIGVTYHLKNESPNEQRQSTLKLTVNPDPKSLWKNVPSDTEAPYWRADEACTSLQGAGLRILAASKRGRSHAHVGSFRDDDVQIGLLPEAGWAIAVVSDGAGSAKYSRQGAALICQVAKERLSAALAGAAGAAIDGAAQACHAAKGAGHGADQGADSAADTAQQQASDALRATLCGVVGNAAYYAAKAIVDECASRAGDLQAAVRDYASTALIAICKRYPFGTLCAAWWVGDGAIGVYSRRDGVTLLGEVDSGEYSGQTRFLESAEVTHEALLKRTRFALVDNFTALVLMSDGVSDPKFETEARLARAADWDTLWNDIDQAVDLADPGHDAAGKDAHLLAWLDFWSQGNHDDRSIAIIQ